MLRAINPTTGEVAREVAPDTDDEIEQKLDASRRAFASWRKLSFEERGAHLRAVAAQLRADVEELAPLMTEEMGKPIREARGEIEKCAWTSEHYAAHAAGYLADVELESDATRSFVSHLPLGVVLGVLPWNSPFWLAFRVAAPALMAGNTVIIKPDPHVPECGAGLARVFERAGVPDGVLSVVRVETPRVEGLIRDPRVAAVSFTGSTRGGKIVSSIAGEEIKPAVLELGGSDPSIVLADADLDEAARILTLSRLIATGQSCIAPKRLIVVAEVYDAFVSKLEACFAEAKMGDPADPETTLGPMARADLRDELHRQVTASVEQGARRVTGGELPDGPGCFYPPTLLADVTDAMTVFREETFGPVAAVIRADDAAHALELANRTEYGLAASVWTADTDAALALARDIEAGQVVINGVVKTDPRLPSGGIKQSGYGRELGPQGIREFVNPQQVWVGPKRPS